MIPPEKIGSALLLVVVVLLVGYSTWELFRGNFGISMATFPLLAIAYLFIMSRRP